MSKLPSTNGNPSDKNNIFLNGSSSSTDTSSVAKNVGKFNLRSVAKGLNNDLSNSLKDIKSTLKNSIRFGKEDRETDRHFKTISVNTDNLHKNSIEDILNNVLDGNLFDAGVKAIRLHNSGGKFTFIMDQEVDKDIYAFKYLKYFGNDSEFDYKNAETDKLKFVRAFVEGIEDPTLLGYGFKLDMSTSPLLKQGSALESFIEKYKGNHPELRYANDYLKEFRNDIKRVFEMPSSKTGLSYKTTQHKNHYIAKVSGLDMLDQRIVEYGDDVTAETDSEAKKATNNGVLSITLNEDVRMFTTRMAFLYRNLIYSYKMGKKLIPENLLRFNLFIKISDYRSFTGGGADSNLQESIRDKNSRMVYELKECEFIFDGSTNPETLSLGGFGDVNRTAADLSFKIKYRKVNRFFYSTLFSSDLGEMVISDKYYIPNTADSAEYLRKHSLIPSASTSYNSIEVQDEANRKRAAHSNNRNVVPTIADRYNSLKNNGLLRDSDNDSVVGRFAKKAGNNAIKAAIQPFDEGLKKVKNKLNDVNIIGNKNPIRSLLSLGVKKKINLRGGELGDSRPLGMVSETASETIQDPTKQQTFDAIAPVRDLHPELAESVVSPSDTLHTNVVSKVVTPTDDLHETLVHAIAKPDGGLHKGASHTQTSPSDNLHGDVTDLVEVSLGTVQKKSEVSVDSPVADSEVEVNAVIQEPSEVMHSAITAEYDAPNSLSHEIADNRIETPVGSVNNIIHNSIQEPLGSINEVADMADVSMAFDMLHPTKEVNTIQPNGSVNAPSVSEVGAPEANVNETISSGAVASPDADLHPETEHKIEQSDKYSDIKEFLKRKK
jgi:hypothetical protein